MTSSIITNHDSELAPDDLELRDQQHARFEQRANRALRDGLPPNTRRAYSLDFSKFRAWCEKQSPLMPSCPTNEAALLGFITDLDTKHHETRKYPCRSRTIERRLSGIAWAHAVQSYPSPITPRVSKVLHAIKARRAQEGERPPRQAAPITLSDLSKISRHLGDGLLATRNRALVLLGWVCAMRRSEISALEREDISKLDEEGFMLTIRRSKSDQLGAGHDMPVTAEEDPDLCPVRAMRAWLAIRGHEPGPLFWRSGWRLHDSKKPLSDKQISRIVIKLAKDAGLKTESKDMEFSAHSLRAGFITEAIRNGLIDREIMERSRHKSHDVFLGYVRIGQNVKKNVATGFTKWSKGSP